VPIIIDHAGIFESGTVAMYQMPCGAHFVKLPPDHTDADLRAAVLDHLAGETIAVRLGPGNPIIKTLEPPS